MPITIGQRQNDQGQNLGTGITQVDFIFNNNDYLSLIGMNSWTPNVGLSIITGVNGVGKTQLLDCIENGLKSNGCQGKILD